MGVVKLGVVKLGNLGTSLTLELLLDERADREDLEVRVFSSGTKLTPEHGEDVAKRALEYDADFYIVISPNAALPGPTKTRQMLKESGKPVIVVSDGPAKKAVPKMEEEGFGYIVIDADAMLGARREFLDPIENALFNADILKVLAITGVFNVVYEAIDKVIEAVKKGEKPELPKISVNKEMAIQAANFQNPYAMAKAMAAYEMCRKVADLTVEGCFVIKERERYIPVVAAAHELMRIAAALADEAREIEKSSDSVYRAPHYKDGRILKKRRLLEKPA